MRRAFILGVACAAAREPEELVNIRQGTYGMYQLSTGNTLPLVGLPWGQSHWAPETGGEHQGNWWFNNDIPKLAGVRCTHQPSPWISEWGNFRVETGYEDEGWDRAQPYNPDDDASIWSPYHFGADLLGMATEEGGNARVDLTASSHGAIIRFRWPKADETNGYPQRRYIRFYVPSPRTLRASDDDPSAVLFTGGTAQNSGGIGNPFNFTLFFDAELKGAEAESASLAGLNAVIAWYPITATEVTIRIGISLINAELAKAHRLAQIPDSKTFEEMVAQHKQVWHDHLSVIEIEESGFESNAPHDLELRTTFYSSFYHALMFPRNLGEDVDGVERHWSPYDPRGRIFDGPCTTDSGFWDSYHTMYTFLQMFFPSQNAVLLQGYVNAYKEGGWVPQWGSPGYRGSMVGTMSDVSFADAIYKGLYADDAFNVTGALEGMRTNAFEVPRRNARGRRGLQEYTLRGFIPRYGRDSTGVVHEVVAQTLNHAFADWAIARAARSVEGQQVFSQAELFQLDSRGSNWKNLFDPDVGFFRAKDAEGNFIEGFDQYLWGGDLTEGGPWQFRFYAPHDPSGMATLYGGAEEMCEKLDEANTHPGYVHRGPNNYGQVIHEMIEMPVNVWGQNSHNNQPSHHFNYMFVAAFDGEASRFASCLARGQHWLRYTMLYGYNSTHFTGDEDNGEMGAWFVLSSLGLYDMAPSSGEYMLGIPLFKRVKATMFGTERTINGGDCNHDVYEGTTESDDCVVVKATASKDNTVLDRFRIPFETLRDSDVLTFEFGAMSASTDPPTAPPTAAPPATTEQEPSRPEGAGASGPAVGLLWLAALFLTDY